MEETASTSSVTGYAASVPAPDARRPWRRRALAAASLTIVVSYLLLTPGGVLSKADMVAYAICHRIPSHSLVVNQRPLPLCARCTGTYLGAMLALGALFLARRRFSELPTLPVLLALAGFTALMGVDGLNSFLTLLPGRQAFYPPQNWLRLFTGALNGLMMGSIIYPVAMGTFWRDFRPERILTNYRELGGLVLLTGLATGLALTGWPAVLYPLALLSSAGVVIMLTLVNTVVLLILARRENTAESWRDLALPLLAGLAASLALIGCIDLLRYAFTGMLAGLPGLPQ